MKQKLYYTLRKLVSVIFLISSFTFSQEWQLTQNEVLNENQFFETVYLNGYTLEITKGMSTTYLYGSGTIIATNNPALAICSYECGITLPDISELGNYSIPGQCDTTLGLFDYTPQELKKGIVKVYDLNGKLILEDKYNCNLTKKLKKNITYIIILYIRNNIRTSRKIIIK